MALHCHTSFAFFGQNPKKGTKPKQEDIMTKAKKTERRTIIGRVARVEDAREYEGDVVINIDIETTVRNPKSFQMSHSGDRKCRPSQGKRLSEDLTVWVLRLRSR